MRDYATNTKWKSLGSAKGSLFNVGHEAIYYVVSKIAPTEMDTNKIGIPLHPGSNQNIYPVDDTGYQVFILGLSEKGSVVDLQPFI